MNKGANAAGVRATGPAHVGGEAEQGEAQEIHGNAPRDGLLQVQVLNPLIQAVIMDHVRLQDRLSSEYTIFFQSLDRYCVTPVLHCLKPFDPLGGPWKAQQVFCSVL